MTLSLSSQNSINDRSRALFCVNFYQFIANLWNLPVYVRDLRVSLISFIYCVPSLTSKMSAVRELDLVYHVLYTINVTGAGPAGGGGGGEGGGGADDFCHFFGSKIVSVCCFIATGGGGGYCTQTGVRCRCSAQLCHKLKFWTLTHLTDKVP